MATKVKLIADGVITPDQITLTTASTGTNTTAPATTAFVQQEISALVDSSPEALNTLNELAAALGDDENFSTTVTDSIATKLPLAGGALTGNLSIGDSSSRSFALYIENAGSAGAGQLMLVDSDNDTLQREIRTDAGVLSFDYWDSSNRTNHLTILANGKVGIGEASPDTILHIKKNQSSANSTLKLENSAGGNNSSFSIDWQLASSGTSAQIKADRTNSPGAGDTDLIFSTSTTGTALVEAMRIDSSGNVGIGDSSPSAKLEVRGSSNSTYLIAGGDDSLNGRALTFTSSASANFNGAEHTINAPSSQGVIALSTYSTERMRIDSSGDVLIGQTSQTGYAFAQKLVVGDGDANDGITIQSGSTHQGNLAFNHSDGTTAHGRISYQHNSNYMQFFTDNTEKMRIENGGSVGIWTNSGKTDAQASLDIAANVGVSLRFSSTYNYGPNRDWQINTNNYGSTNWGGWSLEQSTSQQGTPSVARIGVHANGNVGINMGGDASSGLTSINPATALHVGGDITVGSADAVGTSGTASIRFQNDNERSRITSNYDSGGGGRLGFWTDSTGGTLLQRMYINNEGRKVTNNVNEYYERIFLVNNTSYTFDIDVKSIGASGQILEVFAGYTHYSTSYGAVLKQVWSQRSTAQSDVQLISSIVNHSTGNAGAWSFSYVDADTVRLTKSAGTYGGSGWGYILIRSPD